ncbi:MAG: hypothetical protein WDO06_01140 [Actinomycetota bacterium]
MSLTFQYLKNRKAISHGKEPGLHGSHYFLFLTIDALATFTIVLATMLSFSGHGVFNRSAGSLVASQKVYLEHAGATVLNVAQLESHVPLAMHSGSRYWLGARNGYSYTTKCTIPGEMTVTYLRPGETITDPINPPLSVTVYENEMFFAQAPHPLNAEAPVTMTNSRGDVLTFDAAKLVGVKVSLSASSEVVLIRYPEPTSVATMIKDSESLMKVPKKNSAMGEIKN